MDSALLICDSPKGTIFYKDFLEQNGYTHIEVVENGEEAKRKFIEGDFVVCVINSPLRVESGEELAISIAEKNVSQVILFIKAEIMEEVTSRVEDFGVITVSKPISKQMFWSALKLGKVAQRRIEMMRQENIKLRRKMDELKTVTRAKLILMQYDEMSEAEAHRFIEKKAMDDRISRLDVAKEIIETYE